MKRRVKILIISAILACFYSCSKHSSCPAYSKQYNSNNNNNNNNNNG